MLRFFSVVLSLLTVFSPSVAVFAEEASSGTSDSGSTTLTTPLNCFDFYKFGSVQANLQPSLTQTLPGASMSFSGDLINSNAYPLIDGALSVRIFREDADSVAAGDGNPVVDQFVIKEGITIPANGKIPLSYDWKVPVNAEGGKYYAAYYFATAKRYNLMGLSYSDETTGNKAPFTITALESTPKVAKLSRSNTSLNGKDNYFTAFPLHFSAGEAVTAKTSITNPTDSPKMIPMQWTQYAWDAMRAENIRFTRTDLVTLAPGETKTVSYDVQAQAESVVYLTAVTQDVETKSVLNIRYIRDDIPETKLNFPGITAFPLKSGEAQTLFACAYSTNVPVVPGNTLTLTLKDKEGKIIHEYKYDGDVGADMGGFGDTFTPEETVNYATLTATLQRDGAVVDEVTVTYDCSVIDPNSCLQEGVVAGFFNFFTKNVVAAIAGILIVLVLIGVSLFLYKRRKNQPDLHKGDTPMTTPMA
jgi:uncharacterized protein YxeA